MKHVCSCIQAHRYAEIKIPADSGQIVGSIMKIELCVSSKWTAAILSASCNTQQKEHVSFKTDAGMKTVNLLITEEHRNQIEDFF